MQIRLLALRRYEIKVLFEEIVSTWGEGDSKSLESEVVGPDSAIEDVGGVEGDFQSVQHGIKGKHSKRFISLLDVMERYQRHGFFTSPGDLIPNFF